MAEVVQKTYFDTGTQQFIFDAIFSTDYLHKLSITDHPVQTGANISDHAYEEAAMLTFEIGMSDVMQSFTKGQFSDEATRSISAYHVLRELQSQRIPLTVVTKFGTYTNMMVETLAAPDDYTTNTALKATVALKQIFVVNVTTVKISARPQKSEETNEGDQKVTEADQSLLHQLLNGKAELVKAVEK